jgi:hypothetical protein
MREYATGVLMDAMYLLRPQARRKRATWSINGRLSTKK